MQLPRWLFELGLWAALIVVAVGVVYLLALLAREWRDGQLW